MPSVGWNRRWALDFRRFRARGEAYYYGQQWGDPALSGWRYWITKLKRGKRIPGNLSKVIERYIQPFVNEQSVVVEIGAGGGRWTQYLTAARELHLVELNAQFFPYLSVRFSHVREKLAFHETTGFELAGLEASSVDFVFSFGTFVHIEPEGIDAYLAEVRRVMKDGAIAVIHYSDTTKKFFRDLEESERGAFSNMDRWKMEDLVLSRGFVVRTNDTGLLNHSNIIVFEK